MRGSLALTVWFIRRGSYSFRYGAKIILNLLLHSHCIRISLIHTLILSYYRTHIRNFLAHVGLTAANMVVTLSAWVHATVIAVLSTLIRDMAIAVLSTLSRAMAIAVLRALSCAMTISLRIVMTIAVRSAARNAVLTPLRNAMLIASNFSIPYAMLHAESVQVSARCYERSLFFFLYFLSGATARPKTLGGRLLGSSA